MTKEICKCGHDVKDHYKDMRNRTLACRHKNCNWCYQFEAQDYTINMTKRDLKDLMKHKNHSQQENSKALPLKDSIRINQPAGTFNLSKERKIIFNLLIDNSDVLGLEVVNFLIGLIKKQDKEFIQRLKEKMEHGYENRRVDAEASLYFESEINKLAGDDLK